MPRKFIEVKDKDGDVRACFLADDGELAAAQVSSGDPDKWLHEWIPNWREIEAELRREETSEPAPAPASRADDVALVTQIAATLIGSHMFGGFDWIRLAIDNAREMIREAERQIGGRTDG